MSAQVDPGQALGTATPLGHTGRGPPENNSIDQRGWACCLEMCQEGSPYDSPVELASRITTHAAKSDIRGVEPVDVAGQGALPVMITLMSSRSLVTL